MVPRIKIVNLLNYGGEPRVWLGRIYLHQAFSSLKTWGHFKHVYCHIGEAVEGGAQMCLAVSYGRKWNRKAKPLWCKGCTLIILKIQGKERLCPTANGNLLHVVLLLFLLHFMFLLAEEAWLKRNRSLCFFLIWLLWPTPVNKRLG